MRKRNVLPMECYSQDNKTFLPFRLITMKNNLLPEEGGYFIVWGRTEGGDEYEGETIEKLGSNAHNCQ